MYDGVGGFSLSPGEGGISTTKADSNSSPAEGGTNTDAMAMAAKALSKAEAEYEKHCKCGHTTKMTLQAPGFRCHGCITGAMQAKMIRKGGADKNRDLETVGSDTQDYITRDVNEHRYGSLWVMLRTQFAVLKMLRHKTAAATAKAFSSAKAEIEALTDPGGKLAYKIQRVGRDPGTE